jgi:hypothetical protein
MTKLFRFLAMCTTSVALASTTPGFISPPGDIVGVYIDKGRLN